MASDKHGGDRQDKQAGDKQAGRGAGESAVQLGESPTQSSESPPQLDVICIGRVSVDLYGGQHGGRLEDMASFMKYIGGCPANISIGCARLGLRAALITRIGHEHMGRFVREGLIREGVDDRYVITDPQRLTALVILGIRDQESFPLIFYRENCADMALCEGDIDPGFIASARAVLVTGTHFSTPRVAAASRKAMELARINKRKVIFDIDYRPNLWALADDGDNDAPGHNDSPGHNDGESRFAESASVTAHIQKVLPSCDLIVGTEEEWHIAGGTTDTIAALQVARRLTDAVLVCKRGDKGCVIFEGTITGWGDGINTPAQKIEVFNVLGAGDGFMAGFLYGWLRGEPPERCGIYANTCGALAASRHGCAPSYPSGVELTHMLEVGSRETALRKDRRLEHIHWATALRRGVTPHPRLSNRSNPSDSSNPANPASPASPANPPNPPNPPHLCAFAFDHRGHFINLAKAHGRSHADIGAFKRLALAAAKTVGQDYDCTGVLVDDLLGRDALYAAADLGIWIGRPIEQAGVYPLAFEEAPDLGSRLMRWPANHCVKVLAPLRVDDPPDIIRHHETELVRLADACRETGHALLIEIINGHHGGHRGHRAADGGQIIALMTRLYDLGVMPDWWKLEPLADRHFWHQAGDVLRARDPHIEGMIILGKDRGADDMAQVFSIARDEDMVRGFAIGRGIFGEAATGWFSGQINDTQAHDLMAATYGRLIEAWQAAGNTGHAKADFTKAQAARDRES